MKKTLALLFSICLLPYALIGADFKYIVYNLADNTVSEIEDEPTDLKSGYFGDKMLFVCDGTTDYYMGVFEVTEHQANKMGWGASESSTPNPNAAWAVKVWPKTNPELPTSLSFSTAGQWKQYAFREGDDASTDIVDYCNLYNSDACPGFTYSLSQWSEHITTAAGYTSNKYGVFDIYGNVEEYTVGGTFYGYSADTHCDIKTTVRKDPYGKCSNPSDLPLRGARLVYTKSGEGSYTVTVKTATTNLYTASHKPGDSVSFTVPTPTEGCRFVVEVTPAELVLTTQGEKASFTMPESNVEITYISKTYMTLTIKDGEKTVTYEPTEGETITYEASQQLPYLFENWSVEGWNGITYNSSDKVLNLTVPALTEIGRTTTFTANYEIAPRVLVYNGTAALKVEGEEQPQPQGEAYGNGFYKTDSTILLTPSEIPHKRFIKWQKVEEGKEDIFTTKNEVTVGANNTTVTYIAQYEDAAESVEKTTMRIGEKTGTEKTRTSFGYTAKGQTSATDNEGHNTFIYHETELYANDYLIFDLKEGESTQSPSLDALFNIDTYKKAKLVMKRIVPTIPANFQPVTAHNRDDDGIRKETLQQLTPYYVAIFETTVAQYNAVTTGTSGDTTTTWYSTNWTDSSPYAEFFKDFNDKFNLEDVKATLPSRDQIAMITIAGLGKDEDNKDEVYTGAGAPIDSYATYYGDTKIKAEEMVKRSEVDPYGFYNLWGGFYEILSDQQGVSLGGGNDAVAAPATCNLLFNDSDEAYQYTVRPAISLLKRHAVKIQEEGAAKALLEGEVFDKQEIILQPQASAKKLFTGWQVTTTSGTEVITDFTEPYVVTEDVTLTPRFEEPIASVNLSYPNDTCTGPDTLVPGATTLIYPPIGKRIASLTVTDEGGAEVEVVIAYNEDGTATLNVPLTIKVSSITLTANYASARKGYRFRIR